MNTKDEVIEFNDLINNVIDAFNNSKLYKDVMNCFMNIRQFSVDLYLHSLKVAFLSLLIGVNQQRSISELKEIFIAAILHDYGKIYIKRSIIEKADVLTLEERKTIELHSIVGYFYLKKQTGLNENILVSVLNHHEKVDGTGYGLHKKGKSISSYAKILMIADVFDAMITDRVYRKKISSYIVKEYLYFNAGKHFDKKLVEQFLTLIQDMDIEALENEFINKIDLIQWQTA